MRRTTIVFFVIVGLSVAVAVLARVGSGQMTAVTGLIGSEKAPFFADERVQKALARHQLQVTVQKAGSREIATRPDLRSFDFAFPAGVPGAEKIQREAGVNKAHSPFFTPMVVASWRPIADLFVQQGIATDHGAYYILDMARFLPLLQNQTRWKDIPGNTAFPANKSVLISAQAARRDGSIQPDMVLMYPTPTIFTKHIVVPFTAAAGRLRFAMTNPAASNSGFTALIGVATAFTGRGDALRVEDIRPDALRSFFQGQKLTAGSSGWLAESYVESQDALDGIINYESVLLELNRSGKLREKLTLIYPRDGIVTADYPLMLLNKGQRAAYDRLVAYLRSPAFQGELMRKTLRRPAVPGVALIKEIPDRLLIELPFPNTADVIDALLTSYLDEQCAPAHAFFVLDVSGSMQGAGIRDLKAALLGLTGLDTSLTGRFARFRSREEVTIITFNGEVHPPRHFRIDNVDPQGPDMQRIREFVAGLEAGGGTAIYSALAEAYRQAAAAQAQEPDRYYFKQIRGYQ